MIPRDGGPVVTVHVWRLSPASAAATLLAVPADRRRLRALDGVRFSKLLGTAHDFAASRPDLTRWMLITSWDSARAAERFAGSRPARRWERGTRERWQLWLRPTASTGQWARQRPFTPPRPAAASSPSAPIAVITRARLRPSRLVTFWRSAGQVARDLPDRRELLTAIGMGEAPIGVQGTFTLWRNAAALESFERARPAHRRAVLDTARVGWYAESLFARFQVLHSIGTVDGRDPLAAVHSPGASAGETA
jgi:hypothetical protein